MSSDDDRKRLAGAARPGELALGDVMEGAAVVRAGERVDGREPRRLAVGALLVQHRESQGAHEAAVAAAMNTKDWKVFGGAEGLQRLGGHHRGDRAREERKGPERKAWSPARRVSRCAPGRRAAPAARMREQREDGMPRTRAPKITA